MASLSRDYIIPLAINLASSAIIFGVARIRVLFGQVPGRRQPWRALIAIVLAAGFFATAEVAVTVGLTQPTNRAPTWLIAISVLVPALVFAYACGRELFRLWSVGIFNLDVTIRRGMDYTRALELANSSIKFLGTGAGKLTSLPIFDEAIRQCASANGELKFLLRKPDSSGLADAARRAGRGESDYQATIVSSLRKLAAMRQQGAPALEVRFYNHESSLRIMIIDNALALLSYNVYGAKVSADRFPQLHIRNRPSHATRSFFWAFDQFFDEEWKRATAWDFQEYIQ